MRGVKLERTNFHAIADAGMGLAGRNGVLPRDEDRLEAEAWHERPPAPVIILDSDATVKRRKRQPQEDAP